MELKYVGPSVYRAANIVLRYGQTTAGQGLTDKRKKQMLADFPNWFEKVEQGKDEAKVPAGTEVETKVIDPEKKSADAADKAADTAKSTKGAKKSSSK